MSLLESIEKDSDISPNISLAAQREVPTPEPKSSRVFGAKGDK